MMYRADFLFSEGKGYADLVSLVKSNPKFVFYVDKEDNINKKSALAKRKGWVVIRHKKHAGTVKLQRADGRCFADIEDESGGHQLIGSWVSWLASNGSELIHGIDIRFAG